MRALPPAGGVGLSSVICLLLPPQMVGQRHPGEQPRSLFPIPLRCTGWPSGCCRRLRQCGGRFKRGCSVFRDDGGDPFKVAQMEDDRQPIVFEPKPNSLGLTPIGLNGNRRFVAITRQIDPFHAVTGDSFNVHAFYSFRPLR